MKPGYPLFHTLNFCLKKPHKTYIGDIRCDTGRVLDYTSYFVTVGLSNTYAATAAVGKLFSDVETFRVSFVLLNSALPSFFFFFLLFLFSFSSSVSFPDLIKMCYSTSVCQALRNRAYINIVMRYTDTKSVARSYLPKNIKCRSGTFAGPDSQKMNK